MSISAIGGVSGTSQSLINMANYNLDFNNDVPSPPPPQNTPTSMISTLMQILLQVMQQGSSNSGKGGGGGQRGGGYQGDCQGGNTEAAQGNDGARAADSLDEAQAVQDPQDGAHGLLDAIAGLLAAIVPLLGGTAGDGGGGGGGGHLSTNDEAALFADLLGASGF